jgi:hypothetical protein
MNTTHMLIAGSMAFGLACGPLPPHGTGGSGPGPADASADANDGSSPVSDAAPDAGEIARPDCIVPCVWEVLKDCMPPLDSCTRQQVFDTPVTGFTEFCAPSSEWRSHTQHVFHGMNITVSFAGKTCYRKEAGWGSNGPYFARVFDGEGQLIATESQGPPTSPRSVTCAGDGGAVYPFVPTGCDPPSFNCASVSEGTCR